MGEPSGVVIGFDFGYIASPSTRYTLFPVLQHRVQSASVGTMRWADCGYNSWWRTTAENFYLLSAESDEKDDAKAMVLLVKALKLPSVRMRRSEQRTYGLADIVVDLTEWVDQNS